MTHDEFLDRFLDLCWDIYLQLEAKDEWPWPVSQNKENAVQCDDKNNNNQQVTTDLPPFTS